MPHNRTHITSNRGSAESGLTYRDEDPPNLPPKPVLEQTIPSI